MARKEVGRVSLVKGKRSFMWRSANNTYRNPTLEFVAAPALAPAEVHVDPALMEQYQRELMAVRGTWSLLGLLLTI